MQLAAAWKEWLLSRNPAAAAAAAWRVGAWRCCRSRGTGSTANRVKFPHTHRFFRSKMCDINYTSGPCLAPGRSRLLDVQALPSERNPDGKLGGRQVRGRWARQDPWPKELGRPGAG